MTTKTETKPAKVAQDAPKTLEQRLAEMEAKLAAAEAQNAQLTAALQTKGPGRVSAWVPVAADKMAAEDTTLGKFQRATRDTQVEAIAKIARKLDAVKLSDLAASLVTSHKGEADEAEFVTGLITKTERKKKADATTEPIKVADAT